MSLGATSTDAKPYKLRVGLIGCGEVAQVVHIPTLGFLSELYQITHLCDVSQKALQFCQTRVIGPPPKLTQDAAELCGSSEVDVVFVVNSDEYHCEHAVLALQHDKHVFVEKPLALNMRDVLRIQEAEKLSKGKVMVGYMRRYALAFLDAIKEIGGMDQILYARVRDIIGPNSYFVGQSGTFPQRFDDYSPEAVEEKNRKAEESVRQGLENECDIVVDDRSTLTWRLLHGLGTHDLSAMREALGMPEKVLGAHSGSMFWNALFQYPGFAVTYESGIDSVPRFDAHIEVYSQSKSVRVQYDTPFVKGLPITLHISESIDGAYQERMIRKTYEDAYTLEMKELYGFVVKGHSVKTTTDDAVYDTKIFQMIVKAAFPKVE